MLRINFFLLTFGIFILFIVLITIFGYFLQYFIFKNFKKKKLSISLALESFGIGTSFYIFYSYFIIDFNTQFNFFFNYLPILCFDLISIIYLINKNKNNKINNLNNVLKKFKNFISAKRTQKHFLIIFVCFLLFLLVQAVIETDLSLPAKDPYNWFYTISYLHKYGDLDYNYFTAYGVGFVSFNAGALLITNDYYIIYFFVKYNPIFMFSLVILLVYDISKKIFKQDYEILATLIILLCFNSLLFRFFLCVPSLLATIIALILFNTFFNKETKTIYILRGILLGAILLIHIYYFALIIAFILAYECLYLLINLKSNIKTKEKKNLEIFLNFLKKYGIYLLIIAIFSIPYIINLIISDENLFGHINRYLYGRYSPASLIYNSIKIEPIKFNYLIFLSFTPSTQNLLANLFFIGLDIPINKTLGWGFIFLVLGLFYFELWNSTKKELFVNFIKFSFVLSFLIFIFDSFLFIIDNSLVFSIASFIFHKGKRVFEIFSPLWSILVILGLKNIISFIRKIKIKKISKNIIDKTKGLEIIDQKLKKIYSILLLILVTSLYTSHLYIHYNVVYTNYYKDDDLTEAVLFIGDYFNKYDIEDEKLLAPKLSHSYIYSLICQKDIEIIKFEYDETSYDELLLWVNNNNTDYVLVDIKECKSSCIDYIDDNMKILYENKDYLFFKVK